MRTAPDRRTRSTNHRSDSIWYGRIEDQQNLVRRAGDLLGHDAANLVQLLHQMGLRVQPARGIDDQHVELAGDRLLAGVVSDAGGIAALGVLDDLAAEPFAPDGE